MTQNRQSGATASAWGRETAQKVAHAIGATAPSGLSNECSLNGERIVIKCAAVATDQVGVTYNMVLRLMYIFGAFQRADGRFDIYKLDARLFDAYERPTRSTGPSAGRVGKLKRSLFETKGSFFGTVALD